MTPREYFGRLVASDLRRADLAGKTLRALTGPDDSFPLIVEPPRQHLRSAERLPGGILAGDDRQPLPQGDPPMQTPHEAAVAHLKTLDRAEHPEIEELLAFARMYPVDVQAACTDAVKRGGDAGFIDPIKAIADRQAVELQEMLEAFTSKPPEVPAAAPVAAPVVLASGPFNVVEPAPALRGAPLTAADQFATAPPPFREGIPSEADLAADKEARTAAAVAASRAQEQPTDHPTAEPAALDENHPAQ